MVTSGCCFFITAKLFTRHATSVSVYCISSPLLPSRIWSRDLDNYFGLATRFQRYTSKPLFTVGAGSHYNKKSGNEQDQRDASSNNAIAIYLFLFLIELESDRRISLYTARVTPREWETPQLMPRENGRTVKRSSLYVSRNRDQVWPLDSYRTVSMRSCARENLKNFDIVCPNRFHLEKVIIMIITKNITGARCIEYYS